LTSAAIDFEKVTEDTHVYTFTKAYLGAFNELKHKLLKAPDFNVKLKRFIDIQFQVSL